MELAAELEAADPPPKEADGLAALCELAPPKEGYARDALAEDGYYPPKLG